MSTLRFVQPSRRQLWWAALKPPMYSVAIVPIMVGTALAFAETQQLDWSIFLVFLGSAILIIAWMNLSNDVFDAETGIDKNKAHSVVNLTGKKDLVFWLSSVCLSLGLLGILVIATRSGDWRVGGMIAIACILGYTYQGPPFRLGYLGLGELICFVTFGPLAITAAYYSQAASLPLAAGLVATIIGLSTALILFCSHFHQVEDDLAAGKRSPIVRLGTARGAQVLALATGGMFAIAALGVLCQGLPLTSLVMFASLPIAVELIRYVQQHHDQPERVRNCKFIAVKLHFWSGMLLALGLAAPVLI
ncbi:MAG: 2-carboxy-1,4-naphthoquinone phytyltransferase [Spirulinaceae cyanobacterium SM2_1_0]|nr:2-carboxy-1,4-naphthoquinone phytyltransferase [Spirulinaceae cyanobacterium SM2_1_0]